MLFPDEDDCTRVWSLVAHGVAQNRLGPGAKIATDTGGKGARLICVYTKNFSDMKDVKRVLHELVDMGLVSGGDRGIYYKCDAYTYLGIESGNTYGLRASLYSSRDMLKE